MDKCEEVIQELEINSTTTQTQINELFNKIRIELDKKQKQLLNKLDEIKKLKIEKLKLQKEELKSGIESIIESYQMIENSDQNKNDFQESRLNQNWKIEPCHNSIIELLNFEKEEELIYSSISNIGIKDLENLILTKDKQIIYENEEFSFEIISYSNESDGNTDKFKIIINAENDENENTFKIIDLNNGKYEVKMKLKNKGKYSVFVQYDGFDINSSPFQIQILPEPRDYNEINESKLTVGSKGNGNGQFYSPHGITVDSNGNIIIVCDWGSDRIQIFDSQGKFISTFGTKGNENGQFNGPKGITINSKGNIIVSDKGNYRIQIFNSEGNFISTFGSEGIGNGQLNNPTGICVDKNDNIYVCDHLNNRIQIFDSQGKFLSTFGSKGTGNGHFYHPMGIVINSKGNILVCDSVNNRVQLFDSNGKFISTFGTEGKGNGQFIYPHGICVDSNDNILVCDHDNNRIQIFNSNGEYITQFKVNQPTDITIDPNTQNIIVSQYNHQVSIF